MAKIGVQGMVLFARALPTARHRISVRRSNALFEVQVSNGMLKWDNNLFGLNVLTST
jgi:hypothetical protein